VLPPVPSVPDPAAVPAAGGALVPADGVAVVGAVVAGEVAAAVDDVADAA
jgi:hypothetical protein